MLTEKEIHDVPETQLDMSRLPQHIAIIMDGNGRWAQARGMERAAGHVEGVTTVRRITEECSRLGIGYLTLYAFSTENWNRPQAEVDALMHLIATAIERETPDLIKDTLARLERCVRDTSGGSGLTLVLAISYSSRWEITDAARRIAAEAAAGRLDPASITDDTVARNLATAFMPDPDLLIRTGGDMRVSNFLLWQIAYSEIYITDIYWPDFNAYDLRRAISDYQSRQRRFGLTGEQVQ